MRLSVEVVFEFADKLDLFGALVQGMMLTQNS